MTEVQRGTTNAELVARVLSEHIDGVDMLTLYRDDENWAALRDAIEQDFTDDCVFAWVALGQRSERFGLEGLRAGWLDWFEPWADYRSWVDEITPVGDDTVVAFARQVGTRDGARIEMQAAAVVTFRDTLISAIDFYATRDEAAAAVGQEG